MVNAISFSTSFILIDTVENVLYAIGLVLCHMS